MTTNEARMSADLPADAITAAAEFIHDDECNDGDTKTCGRWNSSPTAQHPGLYDGAQHQDFYRDKARGVLAAISRSLPDDETAFRHWYDATYGADYPNGTEFDSGEMFEAFAAGWAAALPALTAAAAAHAAADERERIRQLAIDKGATYVESHSWPGGGTFCNSPFADLLGGAADGAHTPGGTT